MHALEPDRVARQRAADPVVIYQRQFGDRELAKRIRARPHRRRRGLQIAIGVACVLRRQQDPEIDRRIRRQIDARSNVRTDWRGGARDRRDERADGRDATR
jgi:hypothetical protein